jgi:hypothetical protein
MNDFFSKLENFFFDILGLILPGAIFLLIFLSPVLLVDMGKMEKAADTSVMLSALVTIWNILKAYWTSNPKSALTIVAILAYLTGHTVKVFSRIKYEFLVAIFDKNLNIVAIRLYRKTRSWIFPPGKPQSGTFIQLKALISPFKNFLWDLFTFSTINSLERDKIFRQNCVDQLNTRLDIKLANDQETVAKLSSVITNQESLRSLGTFYLAKYNLYRSLALIFLLTTCYYGYFFSVTGNTISAMSHKISGIILAAALLLWFTFNSKYKRYWTLYGGERILTLFYFLNKKKINEGG